MSTLMRTLMGTQNKLDALRCDICQRFIKLNGDDSIFVDGGAGGSYTACANCMLQRYGVDILAQRAGDNARNKNNKEKPRHENK